MSDTGAPGPSSHRPWWEQQLGRDEEQGREEEAATPPHESRSAAPPRRFPPSGRPPSTEPPPVPPFAEPPRHLAEEDGRTDPQPLRSMAGPQPPAFATDPPPPHPGPTGRSSRPPAARPVPPTVPVAVLDEVDDLLQRGTEVSGHVPDPRPAAVVGAARAELAVLRTDPVSVPPDLVLWRLGVPGALVGPGYRERTGAGTVRSTAAARRWLAHLLAAVGVVVLAEQGAAAPSWLVAWSGAPWPVSPWGLGAVLLAAQLALLTRDGVRTRAAAQYVRSLAQLEAELAEPLGRLRAAVALRGPAHDLAAVLDELRATVDAVQATLPEAAQHTAELARQTPPVAELARVTLDAAEQVRLAVAEAAAQLGRTAELAEREADRTAAVEAGERPFVVAATSIESATGQLAVTVTKLEESVRDMESAMARADWLALVADGLRHDWPHDGGGRAEPRS